MQENEEEKITIVAFLIELKVWKEALSNFKKLYGELDPRDPETHRDLGYYHSCIIYAEWKLSKLNANIERHTQKRG